VQSGLCKEISRAAPKSISAFYRSGLDAELGSRHTSTAPVIITKDLETGRANVGTYRLQLRDARRAWLDVGPPGSGEHIGNNETRNRHAVAIAIGVDPTIVLTSISKFRTARELSVAAGCAASPCPGSMRDSRS